MSERISGIHHVTAITADGQKNIDFYCGVLGLRLVKVTVNFDDPQSYHLYYGDELGRPGSAMTFFVWPGAERGRLGSAQVTATAFSIPHASVGFWKSRLEKEFGAAPRHSIRFGEPVLAFDDPDGTPLELIASSRPDSRAPWPDRAVPTEHAVRGFGGVTLSEEGYEHTAELLTRTLGFEPAGQEGNRFRFVADGSYAQVVDLLCVPDGARGSLGGGIVHHVAFRAADEEAQRRWRQALVKVRHNVTPVIDRTYFHSLYFREPGGVLFEIATDRPGFTVDETPESLGTSLRLPPQHEPSRRWIESVLPPLRLPRGPKA